MKFVKWCFGNLPSQQNKVRPISIFVLLLMVAGLLVQIFMGVK